MYMHSQPSVLTPTNWRVLANSFPLRTLYRPYVINQRSLKAEEEIRCFLNLHVN